MNKIIGVSDIATTFQKLSGFEKIPVFSGEYAATYFLLHEDDSQNIKETLKIHRDYPDSKIYCILIDAQLGEKLKTTINNFEYFIPSELVATKFVEGIKNSVCTAKTFKRSKFKLQIDPWFKKAFKYIFVVIVFSTLFFKYYYNFSFINSLYFTLVQMITGGDTSLMPAPTLVKFVATGVMICGIIGIAIIIALMSDFLLTKKQELILGIKKYKGKNHIIVVGGGAVGFNVIKKLLTIGEKPILIDKSISGPFIKTIKNLNVPVLIGDARISQVLFDAGLGVAKALIVVTDDDLVNLEVGLDTKILDPDLRVVLRIFDNELSNNLKDTKLISYSYSMSYTAAEYLLNLINKKS